MQHLDRWSLRTDGAQYAQALLSGCVVAADLPTEQEGDLSRFMIQLSPTWSFERIEQELQSHLQQPEKLQQMAVDGFLYAREHLTTMAKLSSLVRMVDAYRDGVRGYDCESQRSVSRYALMKQSRTASRCGAGAGATPRRKYHFE